MVSPDIPRSAGGFRIRFPISAYEHGSILETTRTYRAKIINHAQVSEDFDARGHSVSKLWNVARYHSQQECDEPGGILLETDLERELTNHERYSDVYSQSSQRALREHAEAFNVVQKAKERHTDATPPTASEAITIHAPP